MVVLLAISPGGRATRVGPAFSNRLGRRSLFVVTLRLNNGVWAVFAPETVGEGGSQRPTWSPQAALGTTARQTGLFVPTMVTRKAPDEPTRLERFCTALSAPAGMSRSFYVDYLLTLLFVPAAVAALALSTKGVGALGFWVAVAIAGGCLGLATRKRMLFAGALGMVMLRFGFSYVVTREPLALIMVAASALGLWLLLMTEQSDEP